MARVKVTSSDINARLARGECANFRNGCRGRTPCAVVEGETCQYFDDYVKPLLDMPEFAHRYAREAKVKLALNPNAKVVRKRRDAGTPRLDLPAEAATEKPAKAAPAAKAAKPKAAPAPAKPARKAAPAPQLKIPATPPIAVPAVEPPAAEAAQPRAKATPPKAREKAPAAAVAPVPKEKPRKTVEDAPAAKATPARTPHKTEVAAEQPAGMVLELAPEKAQAKKNADTMPARRQPRAPKADSAPALDLTAKPEPAPKRAPRPTPAQPAAAKPAAAKPAPAQEPPAEKRSIMITPQLELVLDFPLERPARVAAKRR